MGRDWVARRQQQQPPAEGSERWQLRVSDASAGDGFALVQHSLDARDECREQYYWLLRSVRPCAAVEVEVRLAATDCCAAIPCRVDARVLTFRLISAVTDRDLSALRGLLHPSEPLRASAAGVSASFTRATLSAEVFHALGDWTWPRGALPPPTACGSAVAAAGEGSRTVRCRAWAGGAPWELSWASDRLGTFLVGMRALLE
jgi:hypothetical protein